MSTRWSIMLAVSLALFVASLSMIGFAAEPKKKSRSGKKTSTAAASGFFPNAPLGQPVPKASFGRPDHFVVAEPVGPPTLRVTSATPRGANPLHDALADAITAANLSNPQRLAHFQWMNQPGFRVVGWSGTIQNVSNAPNGKTVTMRLSPEIQRDGGSATHFDYMLETYFVNGKEVTFLGAVHPPGTGRPCSLIYD